MNKAMVVATGLTATLAVGFVGFLIGQRATSLGLVRGSRFTEAQSAEIANLRAQNERLNSAATQQARETAALREENERLAEQLNRSPATGVAGTNSTEIAPDGTTIRANQPSAEVLVRLRELANLQKKHIARVTMEFVDDSGKLTDKFAELFSLSSAEREGLQQAYDRVRQQLDATSVADAKVTRDSAGSVVIRIPPSAGGAPLYDQVLDGFAQTLGAERYAAFFELGSQQLENALGRFGAEDRTLTISKGPPRADGRLSYTIKDEHKSSNGSRSSTRGSVDQRKLLESLGSLANLLPSDFRGILAAP